MRYIVDSNNRVLAVNFGSIIHYTDCDCSEYTGRVPSGWNSLEEWHDDEGEKLWRWKIVGGNLTLDSSAKAPEEGRWGVPKLQDKSVTGAILDEKVVTADVEYDGLRKVTIEAQRCFYAVGENDIQTTGGFYLYVPLPADGRMPTEIIIEFASNHNLLSANQISMAHFTPGDYKVTIFANAGNGTIYQSTDSSQWEVGVENISGKQSIKIGDSTRRFYYSGTGTQTLYRCYLLYDTE